MPQSRRQLDAGRLTAALSRFNRELRIADAMPLLKELHETVRALRSKMDLSNDSSWGSELAGLRTEISDLLGSEIEMIPARVRRMLRPPSTSQVALPEELDQREVAEIEERIVLAEACRHYAGELALNRSRRVSIPR